MKLILWINSFPRINYRGVSSTTGQISRKTENARTKIEKDASRIDSESRIFSVDVLMATIAIYTIYLSLFEKKVRTLSTKIWTVHMFAMILPCTKVDAQQLHIYAKSFTDPDLVFLGKMPRCKLDPAEIKKS